MLPVKDADHDGDPGRPCDVGGHPQRLASDLHPGGELHAIRAFGAKMGEHAGRLAAVLSVADPDASRTPSGITLAQHSRPRCCGFKVASPRPALGRPVTRMVAGAP